MRLIPVVASNSKRSQPGPKVSRRAFLKIGGRSLLGAGALCAGGLLYAWEIEPDWVEITHVELTLPHLAREFHGYRVLQLSDIHMDGRMTQEHLDGVIRMVNEQRPDLVVITGDFVTYSPNDSPLLYAPALVESLGQLEARDASVAILGNHDHWTDAAMVRQVIRDSGMVDLSNRVHTVSRAGAHLLIAGVDDYWERKDRLDLVMQLMPPDGAAILLAHEPDFADISAKTGRFDLQLSGHSHGGQVRLPLMGPPVLPKYAERYPAGRYQVDGMIQYTNRGLGALPPNVRFNCRPEVTVITLLA